MVWLARIPAMVLVAVYLVTFVSVIAVGFDLVGKKGRAIILTILKVSLVLIMALAGSVLIANIAS